MHGLDTLTRLNTEAIDKARNRSQEAIDGQEETPPTFTLAELEDAREEALEQGREEGLADSQDEAWNTGYEDGVSEGHAEGYSEAESEFAGGDVLRERLQKGGIDPLDPVTLRYDPALGAIVYTQGPHTVLQRD